MTRHDYERAARIAQESVKLASGYHYPTLPANAVVDAFVALFSEDGAAFNEARFRRACVPGANVKARTR